MTENIETLPVTDVKHFVIKTDAEGNETRVEVTADQVKNDAI